MTVRKHVNDWKAEVYPVLVSKTEEFRLMGYNRANSEDVWNCLVKKVWKGNPELRLYQIVEDIMHLSTNKYMSFLTVQAYQGNDSLLSSIEALMGPMEDKE